MLLESDILRLFFTGPFCLLASLFRCLVLTAPPWIHANCSSAACLSALQPPTSPWSPVQLPTALLGRVVNSHSRVPLPLPDTARFHVQESFVWFRAKTDSSALAACPHSATFAQSRYKLILADRPTLVYPFDRSDFHLINSLSIVVCAFARGILTSLLVNEILLPRWVNLPTKFEDQQLKMEWRWLLLV